ncbi:MAG TPA: ribonuclease HI [Gammaproteobacteria bacterium]|jgi:ribonuclease HI|nr:ribonuclease HI [Gammaproteobacteria bacterium]
MSKVVIYTDGACKGNPGAGGWGAYLSYQGSESELYGYEPETTNNRMEIKAAIEALAALKRSCQVDLYTDSEYLRKGVTEWMQAWIKNGWRTAAKKPVKNKDLWLELENQIARHKIDWHWVKGHAGDPGNEKADELANLAISEALGEG